MDPYEEDDYYGEGDFADQTADQWRPARMPRETDWNDPPADWDAEDPEWN